MSIGGALGGLFNALIAPVVFRDTYEYEIALILACLIMPRLEASDRLRTSRWLSYRQKDPSTLLEFACIGAPLLL